MLYNKLFSIKYLYLHIYMCYNQILSRIIWFSCSFGIYFQWCLLYDFKSKTFRVWTLTKLYATYLRSISVISFEFFHISTLPTWPICLECSHEHCLIKSGFNQILSFEVPRKPDKTAQLPSETNLFVVLNGILADLVHHW